MKRLKGPELKMPDLKVPAVLGDVYYDLRERRLLPLIALVVVAIVAVPFLLGDSEEAVPPPAPSGATESEGASASSLTVVEAHPGLRDYRKRLRRRSATNPFEQRYTSANLKGAKLNSPPSEGSTESEASSGAKGGASDGDKSPAGSDGGTTDEAGKEAAKPKTEITVVAWAIDVRIVRTGGNTDAARKKSMESEPVDRYDVMPQTPLPGKKAPVVTYLGPVREGTGVVGKALLLVSTDVESVFGDVNCANGDEICQLVEVEPGMPVTFVYGLNQVHYTVTVHEIEPISSTAAE